MNFFQSIIIGFVQGIGEFLPISSSGHLVLFYTLFNVKQDTVLLSIFLHIATLFSVLYVYREQIIKLIKKPFCKTNKLLILATIPTVIIAIVLKSIITASFDLNFVIFGFLITAVLLGIADYLSESNSKLPTINNNKTQSSTLQLLKQPSYTTKSNNTILCKRAPLLNASHDITDIGISFKQALLMGITQGIACFPGISRSGSTIAVGLMLKGDKNEVTTFSFLLSIPVIIGSLVFSLFDISSTSLRIGTASLIISCLISFLVGIVSIKLVDSFVKKQKLSIFSFYLIGLVFVILFVKFVF